MRKRTLCKNRKINGNWNSLGTENATAGPFKRLPALTETPSNLDCGSGSRKVVGRLKQGELETCYSKEGVP